MSYTEQEHEATHQAVEQMLRDVGSRFPHATVRTDVRERGGPPLLELSCSLPETMLVKVLAGADQIEPVFGRGDLARAAWYPAAPRGPTRRRSPNDRRGRGRGTL